MNNNELALTRLRFFRDMSDAERMKVFWVFGVTETEATEVRSHDVQNRLFNHLFAGGPIASNALNSLLSQLSGAVVRRQGPELAALREALRVAAAVCDVAADWHLDSVQVNPPAEWEIPSTSEPASEGWASTRALALHFQGMLAELTEPKRAFCGGAPNPAILKMVADDREAQDAQLNSDWGDAAPSLSKLRRFDLLHGQMMELSEGDFVRFEDVAAMKQPAEPGSSVDDDPRFRPLSFAYAEALMRGSVPQTNCAFGKLVEFLDAWRTACMDGAYQAGIDQNLATLQGKIDELEAKLAEPHRLDEPEYCVTVGVCENRFSNETREEFLILFDLRTKVLWSAREPGSARRFTSKASAETVAALLGGKVVDAPPKAAE